MNYDSWRDPFTPDDGVALHHGGGSDYAAAQPPFTFEKSVALLQGWERYHLRKGWRGLAYGFGVDQAGRLFRIRGFNRYGAHLGDIDGDGIANNDEIIPIIWLASGNHHSVTPQAHTAINWLRANVIEVTSPQATFLYGHKEIQLEKSTACPGPGGMAYVRAHRERRPTVATQAEKLVIDLAFDLFPEVVGDRTYYYDLAQDHEDWGNLRAAAKQGAKALRAELASKDARSDAEIRAIISNAVANG